MADIATSSAVSIVHKQNNSMMAHSDTLKLPPTPSTASSVSSIAGGNRSKALESSLKLSGSQQKYGSLGSSTPYLDGLNIPGRPLTPSRSTTSTNGDDESLYLLWTQQLLRERGFTPSSCRPDEQHDFINYKNNRQSSTNSLDNEDQDNDSDDSSISDMSFSSDEDDLEEDDRYADEQRRLLLSSPYQPSIISCYSTHHTQTTTEDQEAFAGTRSVDAPSQQNSFYRLLAYLLPCL